MKRNCCTPDTLLEHRELRCTERLPKRKRYPTVPEPIRKETLTRLAGVLSSALTQELKRNPVPKFRGGAGASEPCFLVLV